MPKTAPLKVIKILLRASNARVSNVIINKIEIVFGVSFLTHPDNNICKV